MKKKNLFLGILALTLVFTMTVVGCGDDTTDDNNNGDKPGGGNGNGGIDSAIVTNADEAWVVNNMPIGQRLAYIFKSDGTYQYARETASGGFTVQLTGTYTTNGNTLTVSASGQSVSFSYSVSDNTLTLVRNDNASLTCTRTNLTNGSSGGNSGGTGGNIVNNSGEAWIYTSNEGVAALVFKSDGTFVYGMGETLNTLSVTASGTYTANNSAFTLTPTQGQTMTGTYSLSNNGNTLTVTSSGTGTTTFTRTSGVTIG